MDSDVTKEKQQLQEQLEDAQKVRDDAVSKLKRLQDQSSNQLSQGEERFHQREQELEATIDAKDSEIEELI